ncbi:MAG: DNA mismatch repair endonuclease MutL, partial [Clostridia bacterium]|nr:DNA mismatch repair endonuclease MutL [Clostridia bacterium]
MKKINILSKQTSQLIAAGEVIERPASVVKELLENSIDAGATRITVEIKNGGNKLIKITDNGCGIYREDVKNAFLRHATSKLKNADDLEKISSLGFRGEALASICAVSRVEIITKSADEEIGTQFFINGGLPGKLLDIGGTNGTTILVKDLFYNTPARMKFLKKDVAEANACAGIIDKIALSHPEIAFKFIRDGKETLHTTGNKKISSAIYCVYGKSFFDGMIPVKYEYKNIKIDGFISKPAFSRSSRSMQNFFLNGRYIKTKTGCSALEEAFKNSVMVGKFPYCAIYIEVNPEFVDVNTHPTKTEVKFSDEKLIFEAIYYSVKNALMNFNSQSSVLNPLNNISYKNSEEKKIPPEVFISKNKASESQKPTNDKFAFKNINFRSENTLSS